MPPATEQWDPSPTSSGARYQVIRKHTPDLASEVSALLRILIKQGMSKDYHEQKADGRVEDHRDA
jgi:hypothetical protein